MATWKILCVDDSTTVLLTERSVLARGGYEVITARGGEEGIERARAERPDLVLVDAEMPRLDGATAARRLAVDPLTAAIPVILMTSPGRRPPAGDAPWRATAAKPISAPDLLETVRRCLGGPERGQA